MSRHRPPGPRSPTQRLASPRRRGAPRPDRRQPPSTPRLWPPGTCRKGRDGAGPAREGRARTGPWQTTLDPSPSDHTTSVGVAVATTDSPGTAAVADMGCQVLPSTHSQVGTPTSWARSGRVGLDGGPGQAQLVGGLAGQCHRRWRGRPARGRAGRQPHQSTAGTGAKGLGGDAAYVVEGTGLARRWLVGGVPGRRLPGGSAL